jgi:uracil-DNA glycosylase family 4
LIDPQLIRIQIEIDSCRACVAGGFLPEARPVFRGAPDRRWMIVGQAPAALGHERSAYAGQAGLKLRSWLIEAGFAGADPLEDNFYLTSITKCFPGPGVGGRGDRMPSRAEVRLCAGHLEAEIRYVRPVVVVTLGKLAANVLIGPGSLTELVGTIRQGSYAGHDFTAVPFPHPSGVSRWLNGEPGQSCLQRGLVQLAAVRNSHSNPADAEDRSD